MHKRAQALPSKLRNLRNVIHVSKHSGYVYIPTVLSAIEECPSVTKPVIHYRAYSKVSWFNPLSKFNSQKKNLDKEKLGIIIEEPNENIEATIEGNYFRTFKHYLKTTEIPVNLRRRILSEKLSEFVKQVPNFAENPMTLPILNSVFLNLYNLNGRQLEDPKTGMIKGVLSLEDLITLFEKSSIAVSNEREGNLLLSESMAILAQYFLRQESNLVPVKLLVHVVDLGSSIRHSNFRNTLELLVKSRKSSLNPEFTMHLLKYYDTKGLLTLAVFDDILFVSKKYPNADILDDYFYNKYIEYVELLYALVPPKVHEYKNLERDIDRIQIITNRRVIGGAILDKLSVGVLLKLLRLATELETVNRRKETQQSITKILDFFVNKPKEQLDSALKLIQEEIFKQDFGDEALAETLLLVTWSNTKYKVIAQSLTDYILADNIKFSEILRFQAAVQDFVGNASKDISESELANTVIQRVDKLLEEIKANEMESDEEIDLSELYNRIIQSLLTIGNISPRGDFTDLLMRYFQKSKNVEASVYSYKYRLDKAIDLSDYIQAVNIFEDSLESFTQWPCHSDPTIHRSLNDLIILVCHNMEDIQLIFPIFTKIKQQMVNTQCSAGAIKAMAVKMLQAEYVGDLIEMLKRELPKIDKDDTIKLPIESEYDIKYRELFKLLHDFVIAYNNEDTHETNWVLYGELHKYFHVPYDTYLPAMKFFCEKDRLNAALIIFRQIKKLSELHGNHNHLPPLRDMYMYLFQAFGDKLYEEGVEEVHEYLKMDISIPKQDIALQNAILNAYSNLQEVGKAKDLFISMSAVPKLIGGINEETIQIMIKTYTYSDMIYVQKFWNNLSQYGIIPNYAIYRQYLIAHVYHGLIEDAIQLTEDMKDYDLEVTEDTLLSMYNYSLEATDQKEIAKWASENHKDKWNEVINSGYLKGAEQYMPEKNLIVGSNATS
ncbi:uncharacterized protein AC631_03907 [Debaryomyces fabryi]|uniref:Mitochondrial group I intron splicing factor CCM1 n=1 Tax=Debaryomyces fabryi TaxID=58627 RepID=A0A0V1PVW6_9ASCO|nr:uncharacterized protein AC631_03907 [Debaryomyces fabryi]KSA00342.1 hypothetical protein AC631_03907 [Debaryomyces fabryi]CUM49297.1 unnamed protein product [Debaryomyces fabryi]